MQFNLCSAAILMTYNKIGHHNFIDKTINPSTKYLQIDFSEFQNNQWTDFTNKITEMCLTKCEKTICL